MATPSLKARDLLGHVVLVTGKEEFLNERTVTQVRAGVRAHDPESEYSETEGASLSLATLGELAAPSLFSAIRCVVVRKLEDLPDESHAGILDYAAAPSEDVALVLVHSGGAKGSGVLNKLRKLGPVTEVKSEEVKAGKLPDFVRSEVAGLGSRIDPSGCDLLVQAVGHDLRALAAACHQLVNDFPGETLTEEKVNRYFGGRAEVKGFAVADSAFRGRRATALEELRWALDGGTHPVLVTSAFASSARNIARFLGAGRGMRDADLARELGAPPWKIRSVKESARGWTEESISAALVAVAAADADIKGAAHDAPYTLERLTLTITGLRAR